MDVAEGCLPPLTGSISHYQAEDSGTQTARPATSEASTQTEGFEQEHASTQTRALCVEDVGCQRWCLWLSEQTPARLTLALWLRWPGYIEGIGAMLNGGDMQIGQAPSIGEKTTSSYKTRAERAGLYGRRSSKEVMSMQSHLDPQGPTDHHLQVKPRTIAVGSGIHGENYRGSCPVSQGQQASCHSRGLSSQGILTKIATVTIPASTALPPGSNVFAIGKAAAAERGGKRKKQKNWNGVRRWKHGWKGNSGLDSVLGRLSIHQQILTSEESAFHPLFS
ncbi:hypothetical protein Y1Q_0014977 [Alligator mississippiensis]|uniref:Uncharacterized protein n=1 Tax=Alligator mississippiensis TaxID=8496 RepID=A0A151N8W1_ALLMI|nr:hypothetical protein Y1Q_0014977 [Alligator mississippiensis]